MFADYQASVLRCYQEKKAENLLSTNLIQPRPAKLRDECETVLDKRFSKKDMQALRSFFGEQGDATGYAIAIRRFDVDLFRPLVKFLKGEIKNTDLKNIELLAWLIDFEQRPYQAGKDRFELGHSPVVVQPAGISIGRQVPERIATKLSAPKKNTVIILLILLFVIGGIGYLFWSPRVFSNGQQGCMIWAGDHYQPISCNQRNGQSMIIALDTIKVAHFRKIMRPDTITSRSLGKVWYSKISNNVEYFTADGFHPVHVERHLKPLTQYMIDKHLSHK